MFQAPLLAALDLVDHHQVTRLTSPSGRTVCQVRSTKLSYVCDCDHLHPILAVCKNSIKKILIKQYSTIFQIKDENMTPHKCEVDEVLWEHQLNEGNIIKVYDN